MTKCCFWLGPALLGLACSMYFILLNGDESLLSRCQSQEFSLQLNSTQLKNERGMRDDSLRNVYLDEWSLKTSKLEVDCVRKKNKATNWIHCPTAAVIIIEPPMATGLYTFRVVSLVLLCVFTAFCRFTLTTNKLCKSIKGKRPQTLHYVQRLSFVFALCVFAILHITYNARARIGLVSNAFFIVYTYMIAKKLKYSFHLVILSSWTAQWMWWDVFCMNYYGSKPWLIDSLLLCVQKGKVHCFFK